ncbi:helix-turn-helix transcriptional regulator [Ralstonia pseudosolanacearum]|uniref:Conserved hypothethical protein, DNA-binding domain n=2 Tax=Ralstonia solanacearum TaxID=305 RepID=A0A0S4UZ45_RALSL|nr:DNA-binding protein [Ralstonia pseudosolanacearum]CUV27033.1 Conserved hypothethical protein, DNA-binding domain [Ralstonia solanacearum]MDO3524869.1 DNA-binding protein [Ralstonia pseudosolanacearum]MDO3549388.1 DNA-binding protein [Ralstonia pseudosolanacearum]MDO3554533.1 DNA-binding protein [Ralstonia pseudosolanacearum]MDO3569256.1 DNA-binding protein [Ralstonia pseudosolanacearum]
MAILSSSVQLSRHSQRHVGPAPERVALTETELATRWGLSIKTLQRWRQDHMGPVFCKLGSRVAYLISEIEAYERRVSRNSTSVRAYH